MVGGTPIFEGRVSLAEAFSWKFASRNPHTFPQVQEDAIGARIS
jgi:hypothetical protein